MEQALTTGQAARLCSVTPNTVLNWIKTGRIRARRTAGGHYRIPEAELADLSSTSAVRGFKYCWEFNSEDGVIPAGCGDCLVYQTRAMRCYEMARLAPDSGHQLKFCQSSCEECEYFRLMNGKAANVLVMGNRSELHPSLVSGGLEATFNLAVADCEYSLSTLIQEFRPDYVVLDCGLGVERVRDVARHLVEDPRIHLVRVILAAREDEYPEGCDKSVFARIERPFSLKDVSDCIDGIRELAAKT